MLAGFARFLVCTIGRCFQPAPYKTFRTFLYMRVILDVKVQRLQAFLPQKYFGPCLYNQVRFESTSILANLKCRIDCGGIYPKFLSGHWTFAGFLRALPTDRFWIPED